MATDREQVMEALKALLVGALPFAEVTRNPAKRAVIAPGGTVNMFDGDPGDPTDILLSPLLYTYEHAVTVEIAGYESATKTREQVIDDMVAAVGAAIEADRTLGERCEWVEARAPSLDEAETEGVEPIGWASLSVICTYTTKSPVG